jgi:hypothetical protein
MEEAVQLEEGVEISQREPFPQAHFRPKSRIQNCVQKQSSFLVLIHGYFTYKHYNAPFYNFNAQCTFFLHKLSLPFAHDVHRTDSRLNQLSDIRSPLSFRSASHQHKAIRAR